MNNKAKRIISIILMGLVSFVLIMGGMMKIIDAEPEMVKKFLSQAGFGDYIILLGLTELVIVALFLYPKTHKIGFLLASCYFAGAFCLEISGKQIPAAAFFLIILWIAMFLRNKEMFISSSIS